MPRARTTDDRLLTAAECAERAHVAECSWWGIAKSEPTLRRARRVFRNRTFWLASGMARWLRTLPSTGSTERASHFEREEVVS